LVAQVQAKLRDGKQSESDFTAELKSFDNLLAKHKSEKTDAVAQILMLKAMLYLQVFDNPEKGAEFIRQVKRDFPHTQTGQRADQALASIEKQAAAKKLQNGLAPGTKFPDFNETDLSGRPLSIASLKGKVVLIDFWATWCGPCRAELPNVIQTYAKHHAKGFEIIGVSLDQDKAKLENFTKQNKMTWPQYFDGEGWGNKLAVKYGIQSIPATFLLDGNGKIIGKDLRGAELEAAVTKALTK
jgi:thiol-disulfide isomerase/thioredoxin